MRIGVIVLVAAANAFSRILFVAIQYSVRIRSMIKIESWSHILQLQHFAFRTKWLYIPCKCLSNTAVLIEIKNREVAQHKANSFLLELLGHRLGNHHGWPIMIHMQGYYILHAFGVDNVWKFTVIWLKLNVTILYVPSTVHQPVLPHGPKI
jgi:hypothetical protein